MPSTLSSDLATRGHFAASERAETLTRFEYVRVSDRLALLRAAGDAAGIATSDLLTTDRSGAVRRYEPLPDPVLDGGSACAAWRAAWAVPLELIVEGGTLALVGPAGERLLGDPVERMLPGPCRHEVVIRGGRFYMRIVAGIVIAAMIPLSIPTPSFSRALPLRCPTAPSPANVPPADTPADPAAQVQSQTADVPPGCPPLHVDHDAHPDQPPARPGSTAPKPSRDTPHEPAHLHPAQHHHLPATHRVGGSVPRLEGPADGASGSQQRHRRRHRHHSVSRHRSHHRAAHTHRRHVPPAPRHAAAGKVAAPAGPAPSAAAVRLASAPPLTTDNWGVPTNLLPTYQAAANAYGIPWTVLAAINKIETNFGRNLSVSSAGAVGWMQFMPSTWAAYGVDADGDGLADPYDSSDAIFAAARYLAASGGTHDVRGAVFAYNHASWYVDEVMQESAALEAVPQPLVDALTAVQRGRPPVDGATRVARGAGRSAVISAATAAPVVSPVDGRVADVGTSSTRGRYVTIEDAYGNRYGLSKLARVATLHKGDHVMAGTLLGRLGRDPTGRPSVTVTIRAAGKLTDPAPLLRHWDALSKAPTPASHGGGPSGGAGATPTTPPGASLLLGKERLARRVLADDRITLPECGRRDIAAGKLDIRVLDTLAFLADSGLRPEVAALRCNRASHPAGHESRGELGDAVDISAVDGVPISSAGAGAAAGDKLVHKLGQLQGVLAPDVIAGPHAVAGIAASIARPAASDRVSVEFSDRPAGAGRAAPVQSAADRLDRLNVPYAYGGGHTTPVPALPFGLDCSSSVSWVLQRAGISVPTLSSGQFMRYGEPGPGRYVTIYANAGHVFMSIGGRFFGTSGFGHPSTGTGPHWFTRNPSASYLSQFTPRHPPGL